MTSKYCCKIGKIYEIKTVTQVICVTVLKPFNSLEPLNCHGVLAFFLGNGEKKDSQTDRISRESSKESALAIQNTLTPDNRRGE